MGLIPVFRYFVSETGYTTMSSFESMSATLSEENYGTKKTGKTEKTWGNLRKNFGIYHFEVGGAF